MDPSSTALILIGFQNDYFASDGILTSVIENSERATGTLRQGWLCWKRWPHQSITSSPISGISV